MGKERSSWSGHSGSVLAYAFSKSCQQFRLVPGPDHSRQTGTSCRCAAVFCCCTRLVSGGLRISNLPILPGVELRGFEPRTSCMPSAGSTSTAVRLCRSPSQEVRARPVKSAPVAVLSCCTGQPARPGSQGAPDQPEPPRTLPRCSPRRPASDRARSVPQSTGGSPRLRPRPLPLPHSRQPEIRTTSHRRALRSPESGRTRLNARICM